MSEKIKLGIIIFEPLPHLCWRKMPAGNAKQGRRIRPILDTEIELVGYTTCDGCPGGNVEYTGEEMVKNGATVIHLATGPLLSSVTLPAHISTLSKLSLRNGMASRLLWARIPSRKNTWICTPSLGTWEEVEWQPLLEQTMADEATRKAYD